MGNNKPLLWTAILAAAGTGSAMAQITGTPKAGEYYFKDVATGKFLGAGNKLLLSDKTDGLSKISC